MGITKENSHKGFTSLGKIFLRVPEKSNHQVRTNSKVRNNRGCPFKKRIHFIKMVPSLHSFKCTIATCLDRKMKILHQRVLGICHPWKEFFRNGKKN